MKKIRREELYKIIVLNNLYSIYIYNCNFIAIKEKYIKRKIYRILFIMKKSIISRTIEILF